MGSLSIAPKYFAACALLAAGGILRGQAVNPLPGNPGNIFVLGQDVSIGVPPGASASWQALDYERRIAAHGEVQDGRADLGKLGVGYYRVLRGDGSGITTVAVIAPLAAQTPPDSPIGVDTSAPWFYDTPEQWRAVMDLAKLAGMNWVRDWYHWQEIEPRRGAFLPANKYDNAIGIEHEDGLHNIEVMSQMAAPWVEGTPPHRFPTDLRDIFAFYRELATRWRGKVDAFETWNEPDFKSTGAEIATFQKAAYLGFKAGNPDVTVCLSPWAKPQSGIIQDFINNHAESYFDVYDFHTYATVDRLPQFFAVHEQSSAGKPVWVTEFGSPQPWAGDPNKDEPSLAALRTQTEQIPKLFSAILDENVRLAMYFILGDFVEGAAQFGALHKDLTPRPAYLSLAAVGRLLADARPIGQVRGLGAAGENAASIYTFRALPDGVPRDVVVAWSDQGNPVALFPTRAVSAYDLIGRSISLASLSNGVPLGSAPLFLLFPEGTVRAWASSGRGITLVPPATRPVTKEATPSPVVLQALFSPDQIVQQDSPSALPNSSVDRLPPGASQSIQLFAYNFSDVALKATLHAEVPEGWSYTLGSQAILLPPGGRIQIPFTLNIGEGGHNHPATIVLHADGPGVGQAVLSFEVTQ
jgi:hypothetical protein